MKKREYYNALSNFDSEWVFKSAENPNKYMTKTMVLLHYLLLKKRGFTE